MENAWRARVAERPVGIVGYPDSVTQDCDVGPGHGAVVVLDLDLTMTPAVVTAVDEVAVLRTVCTWRNLPVHDVPPRWPPVRPRSGGLRPPFSGPWDCRWSGSARAVDHPLSKHRSAPSNGRAIQVERRRSPTNGARHRRLLRRSTPRHAHGSSVHRCRGANGAPDARALGTPSGRCSESTVSASPNAHRRAVTDCSLVHHHGYVASLPYFTGVLIA